MTTRAEDRAKADWLRPYKDHLLFPATSIAIEVHGPEKKECRDISEAIDMIVTLMLCMKEHGNDKAAIQSCARALNCRVEDPYNKVFLTKVMTALMPDAVIRTRVKEMAQRDWKSQRQMIREGVWPSWMMEEDDEN